MPERDPVAVPRLAGHVVDEDPQDVPRVRPLGCRRQAEEESRAQAANDPPVGFGILERNVGSGNFDFLIGGPIDG